MAYPRATLAQKSGRDNWYARVQIPERLREALGKKLNVPILKSLGTTDRRIADERLRDKEAEIWREFDRADSVSHPLVIAYMALAEALQVHSITAASDHVEPVEQVAEALFHPDDRWDYYEGMRNQAGFILASDGYGDPEEAITLGRIHTTIEPLMDKLTAEFRKVTTEDYAPKKRTDLFADVAKAFYASSQFLDDKGNVKDVKGYHKAMYAAENVDKIAQHFYEQGKSDATKDLVAKSKNITEDVRPSPTGDVFVGGLKVKAISGLDSSKLKIKTRKFN